MLADSVAGESHLQVLVKGELDGYVSQPQESRSQARVERAKSFNLVHLASGIPGILILPWRTQAFVALLETLRHEPGLDNPDGVRHDG